MSPGWPTPNSSQPPEVARVLITTNALDTNASPEGWIGAANSDPTTVGNNVDAHLNWNFDDVPDVPRLQATNRVFDFPLDLTQPPLTYSNASVVQAFYWCNWMHRPALPAGFQRSGGKFPKQ